jgi:5-methylcytosine-specific restriction endonuclease McrA
VGSREETREIPKAVREAVDARDGGFCRVCGKYLGERRAIHHIRFGGDAQGMGGKRNHAVDNLLSVCWLPGDNGCHQLLHSNKARWMDVALWTAVHDGMSVFQAARWQQAGHEIVVPPVV